MLRRAMLPARPLFVAVAACLAAGCVHVPPPPADTPERAAPKGPDEVLARYVEAIGGRDRLAKVQALTMEARLTILPDEGCEEGDEGCLSAPQHGRFLLVTTADGRMYRRSVIGDAVEERGYDGARGWQRLPDGAVRLDTPAERAATAEDARLHWYFDPRARGIELAGLASRTEAGPDGTERTLDGIAWTVPGVEGPPKALWFDRATGLLVEEVVPDAEGPDAPVQVIRYLRRRTVAGISVPDVVELETRVGPRVRRVRFVSTHFDTDPVDPARFAVPTPAARPALDPEALALVAARARAEAAPRDGTAAAAWARAAFELGRFDEAARAAAATLALDPEDPEALFIAATVDLGRGDLRRAAKRLRAARAAGLHPAKLGALEAALASHEKDPEALARAHQAAADGGGPPIHRLQATRFAAIEGTIDRATGRACAAELPMVRTQPAPVFELRIDGRSVAAIIDTGAADLILDASVADDLGVVRLLRDRLPSGREVSYGRVAKVDLGAVAVENVPVEVFPGGSLAAMAGQDEDPAAGPKVGAIVGLRMLSDFQITFDVPNERIRLVRDTPACRRSLVAGRRGAKVPLFVHDSHYTYVAGRIGDADPGLFLFNTGMRGMDLAASRAAYARGAVPPPVIDPRAPATVRVPRFAVGPVVLSDLTGAYGYFERDRTAGGFRIDGMIGHGALADRAWTLEFRGRALYVAPPASAASSASTSSR